MLKLHVKTAVYGIHLFQSSIWWFWSYKAILNVPVFLLWLKWFLQISIY